MRILYHPRRVVVPVNFGYHYNRNAVKGYHVHSGQYQTSNIANEGWHVATEQEWDDLISYISNNSNSLRETGTTHWNSPNTGATDEYGFKSKACGRRMVAGDYNAYREGIKSYAMYWTNTNNVHYKLNLDGTIEKNPYSFYLVWNGFNIKLVKDDPSNWYPGMLYTGNDGKQYKTTKINGVVWTCDNLKERKYRDGCVIFDHIGAPAYPGYPSVDPSYWVTAGSYVGMVTGLESPYLDSTPY
jgi:uncharacterized protein (TIGR02145 family)